MEPDPLRYFRIEARELQEELARGFLELERGAAAADHIARLFRLAHTLKGAARVVRQAEIAELAHAIEDRLGPYRGGAASVEAEHVDGLLKLVDRVGVLIAALTTPNRAETEGSPAAPKAAPKPEEAFTSIRADVAEMDALLDGVTETHQQLASMRSSLLTVDRARQLAELLSDQLAAPRAREARTGASAGADAIAIGRVRSLADELRGLLATADRSLALAVEQADRELRQVRTAAEGLRLLTASVLWHALERTVRDAAQALGRRVAFEARGGEVRLDSHVLAAVQPALVQLARNAVAHGIEPEAERKAAGKTPAGLVHFAVVRRSGRVVFSCRDDGRGVDLEAVRRQAQSPAASQKDELLSRLLQGGISTARDVTAVSGRGVGLNVVREAAKSLGGDVRIHTESGKGTTVELEVRVSLASIDALLVEAGGVAAALPFEAVVRSLRIADGELARGPHGTTLVFDGHTVPFIALSRALGGQRQLDGMDRMWSVVVARGANGLVALGVDRLLGAAMVVLSPLPELAPATPVVAGTSIDAEGHPQLVLDCDALLAEAVRAERTGPAARPERMPVLVIDDSLTTRMLEQSILESAGYEVDLAASAEEGLERARTRRYALFLVDVEMPGMDGFTFVERTRGDPVLRETPAILVTSRNAPEDKRRGAEAGASAYIVKSEFDQADLLSRIRALVG